MKVLSLFDGISCGMAAFERADIPVERYAAYEIDKYAVQISEKNYPQIEHCGDVFQGNFTQYKGFDILIGGSPCTYWSIARRNRETTCTGKGFEFFMEYMRALKESECRYFLYENNFSIHKNIKNEISKRLGVQPIMINSALVSAQSRKRCYWTNIPGVTLPEDKGILLKDIVKSDTVWEGKTYENFFKAYAPVGCAVRSRYINSDSRSKKIKGGTYSAIECRRDGKANCITTVTKDSMILQPVRIGDIGSSAQGHRVYSVKGKSVTLSASSGGQGGQTGLYKVGLPNGNYIIRKLSPVECERLQTLPDNYTAGVSDTQRYKMLGNGWTVDVIAHILKFI